MADNNIRSIISTANSGKKYAAVDLVRQNPILAATLSKLNQSDQVRNGYGRDGNRTISAPDQQNFQKISQEVSQKTKDAQSIMELFPELELSAQILITSIISPKDMNTTEVTFTTPKSLKSQEVTALMIAELKEYFEQVYKIEPLLPKILRQTLFESGSYPIAVIPENSVDQMINGSSKITLEGITEHLTPSGTFKNIGILGPNTITDKPTTALESFQMYSGSHVPTYDHKVMIGTESYLVVTDNPSVLKLPKVIAKSRSDRISSLLKNSKMGIAAEAYGHNGPITGSNMNDAQLTSLLYKSGRHDNKPFVKVRTGDESARESIGNPLILDLPPESVIPVYQPGNVEKHIGYFVLIDGDGNPISKDTQGTQFDDLQSRLNQSNNTMSSYLTEKARSGMGAGAGNCDTLNVNTASRLYADIVEADLLARLRNGVYGNNVSIANNEEIYRIMLARAMAKQMTQLLYIPIDLVTYFAYKYDNYGIGKSLLADMRILNSMRAMTLFARVMANIKNSIGRTQVDLKLDERDPNPKKTIETAMHEVAQTRQQAFPFGLSTPGDLVDWTQKAGFEFTFSGHPSIPDTSVTFSEKNSDYTKPDDALEEELRKRQIMTIGLPPEIVENGFNSEFATSVVANNLLLAKRVMQIQEIFIPQLTDHARKVARNDGNLVRALRGIIDDNYDKLKNHIEEDKDMAPHAANKDVIVSLLLSEFLSTFEVSLPQPNSITLDNQMEAFDKYVEALDKALNAYINSEILTSDMSGEASNSAEALKSVVKAHFLRKWLTENNVLPELAEMVITSEDGSPLVDFVSIQSEHINAMTKSVIKLLGRTHPVAQAADADIERITGNAELSETTSTDSSSSSDSGGGGDDFGMGGDMEFGMDTPTDDTPADDPEAPTETPKNNDEDIPQDVGLG